MLVEFLEENGWGILNGSTKRDGKEEYTFVGERGNLVIDYVIRGKRIKDMVRRLEIGDKIDYQPVEVWIKGERWRREEVRRGKKLKIVGEYGVSKVLIS